MRADEQKLHRRPSPRASQHMMTKPTGTRDRVNAAVLRREIMNLFGEICSTRGLCGDGSRTEARLERDGNAIEP